jgi:hypothetical protein
MSSKKMTLSADGVTATVEDAKLGDVLTSLIDPDVGLTGMYKLVQLGGLFLGGMVTQNYRLTERLNPFSSS